MKVKHVPSVWIERDGRRLDCGPYLSGALEARMRLDGLPGSCVELCSLTQGHEGGIFIGQQFARRYVLDPAHGVPPSVPTSLIELSTQIILHKCNSPAWLKHVQKANAALDALTPAKLAALGPGEAYVWSSKATDDAFTRGAVKVRCRPRVTRHGGGTKTAVGGPKQRYCQLLWIGVLA